ncbi:MAG: carbohydrate-binding domain-containing protein [Paludibacteraceae bacterium]|nr:carbohydrate-binding domain-containing protein [Paludibacteraceae bacterium]
MKKIATILLSMFATYGVAETQMQIFNKAGENEVISVIKDSKEFTDFSKMDSILFDHFVSMNFNGTKCVISNPYDSVDIKNEDNVITINSEITRHEVKFVISGSSDNASIKINAAKKQTIVLNGVDLKSNGANAPINITSGKTTNIILAEGTKNKLANSANDTVGAVIKSKGQLEFKQSNGCLTIDAVSGHGIQSSDYVEVNNGNISIKSASDGIHVNDYFVQKGGEIDINADADGIDVGGGYVTVSNGSLTISSTTKGAKGIKCEIDTEKGKGTGDVTISGGNIDIRMTGEGARGIKADGNVTVSGGDILVYMTNASLEEAGDLTNTCGIKSSKNVTVKGGEIAVICAKSAKSSRCIQADSIASFVGGQTTIHQNAKGKADVNDTSLDPKRPRGVQADIKILINTMSGNFFIRVPENEGWDDGDELKVKPLKTDGTIELNNSVYEDSIEELYEDLGNRTPEDWKYTNIDEISVF